MQIKLVKGNTEQLFECDHISVTKIGEGSPAAQPPISRQPGIYIEMANVGGRPASQTIVLPMDGDTAYVMSQGKTTEAYRWPIKDEVAR